MAWRETRDVTALPQADIVMVSWLEDMGVVVQNERMCVVALWSAARSSSMGSDLIGLEVH